MNRFESRVVFEVGDKTFKIVIDISQNTELW